MTAFLRLLTATALLASIASGARTSAAAPPLRAIERIPAAPAADDVAAPQAIFGTDDLIDVYQETNAQRLAWSKSVVGLIDTALMVDNGNGTFTINAVPLTIGGDPPCPGQAFANQLQAAHCTGFLVGPERNMVATAGHCIDASTLATTRFVFGFQMQDATTPVLTVPAANVYHGQEIVDRVYDASGSFPTDYALIWLDRPVELPDAQSLAVTPNGTNGVGVGNSVGLIGHAAALPLKLSFGPNAAISSLQSNFFAANVDSHGGNSGSPVFRLSNGLVVGVMVRGQPDVVDTGSCFVWNTLPEANPAQQDIQYAAHFEAGIPKYGSVPGRVPTRTLVDVSNRRKRSFGNSVAGVPDVTGDGRGDVVVGTAAGSINHPDGKGAIAGTVYVFDGVTGAEVRAIVTPYGPGHQFGRHVAGVSDLDGDGRGEIVIYVDERVGAGDHSAYVYSGATGALLRVVPIPEPGDENAKTTSISRIGDVDGDGKEDLIVANRTESNPLTTGGRVHLINPATGALIRTLDSPNPQANGLFGTGAARVPDVNGDGIDDVVVGAILEASGAGRAYIFSGASGAVLRTLVEPAPASGGFGSAVAGLADVNGDGSGDVVVKQNSGSGNKYSAFSGATGAFLYTITVTTPHSDSTALVGLRDYDGDGFGDFAIGTMEGNDVGLSGAGRVQVRSGVNGVLIATLASSRGERGGFLGQWLAGMPDVDGDAHEDLVSAAVNEDPTGVPIDDGRVHIHASGLPASCGNGILEPGEACDDHNTTAGDCCSAACQFESGPRPGCNDGVACTVDTCNGAGSCVSAPNDAACDDGNACSVDTCSATLGCVNAAGNAGAVCRAASGLCDVAEVCDGASTACPADAVVASGTTCRIAAGVCDVAESCDGSSKSCPVDAFASAATECRAAAGDCDLAESCTGAGAQCPADAYRPATYVCRTSAGECDVAETCTGVAAACPANGFASAGTTCTDDGNVCSTDQCDGSGACTHPAGNAGLICRAAAGVCDVAETCDGVSTSCPSDSGAPDGDGDLVCDAQDPCTNVGDGQDFKVSPTPKLILTKINTDTTPGNDQLTAQGVFDLPVGSSFADVNPVANGARVLLLNDAGGVELDAALPGGLYGGRGTRGWKTNGSGTRWQYVDTTTDGSASSAHGGILQLQILDRSKRSAREVMVKIKGENGSYPVVTADAPVQAVVVLGGAAQAGAGLCGESAFEVGECVFSGAGNALKCLGR